MYGFSWNAATLYVFTPWAGIGFDYEALSPMHEPPTVKTGIWFGWGNRPLVEGGFRYLHDEGFMKLRYCEELK